MCMELDIDKIIKLNEKFGGALINKNNLDSAIDKAKREKNIYRSNAHLVRGIIIGHPFLDGNKRTTVEIITRRFAKHNIKCNEKQLVRGLVNIARQNTNVNKISRRLRKWCKKH